MGVASCAFSQTSQANQDAPVTTTATCTCAATDLLWSCEGSLSASKENNDEASDIANVDVAEATEEVSADVAEKTKEVNADVAAASTESGATAASSMNFATMAFVVVAVVATTTTTLL